MKNNYIKKASVHSGNGPLRGGGVRRIYRKPDAKECAGKVETRLGPVMLACLATLATILFVYGLFDGVIHDDVVQFAQELKHDIESLPKDERIIETNKTSPTVEKHKRDVSDTLPSSTTTTSIAIAENSSTVALEGSTPSTFSPTTSTTMESSPPTTTSSVSTTTSSPSTEAPEIHPTPLALTATEKTTSPSLLETTPASPSTPNIIPSSTETTSSPGTTLSDASSVLLERLYQLQLIQYRFNRVHSTVWALFWVNLVALIVLIPFVWVSVSKQCRRKRGFWIAYRIVLVLYLVLFVVQFVKLIHPLLTGAFHFPHALDTLFTAPDSAGLEPEENFFGAPLQKEVRRQMLEPLEARYACSFDPQELLVKFGIQESCLPKLKNYLLPAYTVILMIIIDLIPLLFPVFTYLWMGWIKSWGFVWTLRRRFDENQQRQQRAIALSSSLPQSTTVATTSSIPISSLRLP